MAGWHDPIWWQFPVTRWQIKELLKEQGVKEVEPKDVEMTLTQLQQMAQVVILNYLQSEAFLEQCKERQLVKEGNYGRKEMP